MYYQCICDDRRISHCCTNANLDLIAAGVQAMPKTKILAAALQRLKELHAENERLTRGQRDAVTDPLQAVEQHRETALLNAAHRGNTAQIHYASAWQNIRP